MASNDDLLESRQIYVEQYANGYILADYSGNRGEASYCGVSMSWSRQPIVRDPFPTRTDATIAGLKASEQFA